MAASFPSSLVAAETEQLALDEARFKVEVPEHVLTGVPVEFVRITALDAGGNVDRSYADRPLVEGVRLTIRDRETGAERESALFYQKTPGRTGPDDRVFRDGVFELRTDHKTGRKVYITDSEIVVEPDSRGRAAVEVSRIPRWLSLVPPLLAIVLAIWLRNVVVALFAAVWSGAVILADGNFFEGFVRTLDTYLIGELVQVSDGRPDYSHMMIVLFTMLLGAMIGVMSAGGGTQAIVTRMGRFTKTRERGQLLTTLMGFLVFFDDYANTLLVGGTMRPVTDRLRISREKLAFLVDSTAAPVAGLAVVSTWVGVEIGYIHETYEQVFQGSDWNAYSTFLATLPYRFYPLLLIVFVWLIAYSGRDYGPMLRAEARALVHGQLVRPDAAVSAGTEDEFGAARARRQLVRTAVVPLVALLALILIGLWWTGSDGLAAANRQRVQTGQEPLPATMWSILTQSDSTRVLFLSAFVASIAAIAIAVGSKSLTLHEATAAWGRGIMSMLFAILILVMAWGVATMCDGGHLNTAGFLVELAGGRVSVTWMPALAFLLAGVVSFATGSSFATMGLLMPLFISMTFYLLVGRNDADPNHHLMLGTIGAILAGAIFGDHCSPISDTTVLSSAAAGSDHLDHVTTQLPYAASVGLVSLVLGYIPVGFGYSPLVLLPLALAALYALVRFIGRPVGEYAQRLEQQIAADAEAAENTRKRRGPAEEAAAES